MVTELNESILVPLAPSQADAIILHAEVERQAQETEKAARRVRFRVLERKETTQGDRKVIIRRVAPPSREELEYAAGKTERLAPSPADLAERERLSQLEQALFNYSATVYDREVTRLRWHYGGQAYTAWSNVDFNYLRGVTRLEHEGKLYEIYMGFGNEQTPERAYLDANLPASTAAHSPVPQLPAFTAGRAEYVVFLEEGQESPPDEAFKEIDLLHAYYEQNAVRLHAEQQRSEALKEARKRYDAAHPKLKEDDLIINFWPKKNSAYENGDPAKGGSNE